MKHKNYTLTGCDNITLDFSSPERFIETYPFHLDPQWEKYHSRNSTHRLGFQLASETLGVRISHIREKVLTFTHKGIEIGSLTGMWPSLVKPEAARFCRNKCATLALLKEEGIAVPDSGSFTPDAPGFEAAREHWLRLRDAYDVVIKPSHGSGGSGVTVGVSSESEFKAAWEEAAGLGPRNRQVIIEERIAGSDFRVVVVAGRAICATTRVPAYVTGDGRQSLESLVSGKNRERARHPYHKRSELILAAAQDPTAVPSPGQIMFLNKTANIHTGGEAFDVTPYLPDEVRDLAEAACDAVPGLGVAGVDIIFGNADPKVIEINTSPNYGMHYFPLYGQSRNPAQDVLSEMIKRAATTAATGTSNGGKASGRS